MEANSTADFNNKNPHQEMINEDYLERVNDLIKTQYLDFENLGINLIEKIDNKYQEIILDEFFDFTNESYTPISDTQVEILTKNRYLISKKVYQFICVDFYSTILPSFLENNKINSFNQFEKYLMNRIKKDYSKLKGELIKILQNIYNNIKKLENIDKNVNKDPQFKEILNRYSFYIRLINFGDITNFVHNYWLPMFQKNEEEFIWKLS
jgi:hypothetical protein